MQRREQKTMIYSKELEGMCKVAKGVDHGPAPIPEEGKWVKAKEIKDISGLTHGIGWCAPQQGACKLTLNVKDGIIQEALIETVGCSGMTHSAAMAGEILTGKTNEVNHCVNLFIGAVFNQLPSTSLKSASYTLGSPFEPPCVPCCGSPCGAAPCAPCGFAC